ncbi:MAG: arsenical pump-driving ATPase GET3 [Methanobrevibacter sp.]|jgi:arsenite-transporting ATPase|nr:arsenical pump-driving ATPase GET3 [Methanobrevibacter sp.]
MAIEDIFKIQNGRTSFIFVGGKGGVGKTSVSVATAIWTANHGKKTLIVSTDPAHSLSDSLETYVGSNPKLILPNLYAVEIDPEVAMAQQQEEIKNRKSVADSQQAMGLDLLEDQLDLASAAPGADEAAAFELFLQVMTRNNYDVVVFDTAPTGHTLRFLSFPDIMESWIGKMLKVKSKVSTMKGMFKNLIPFSDKDDGESVELEETKKKIEEARAVMSNPEQTTFKMVLIPEEMSIYESERAMESLKKYNINTDSVIINQLMPDIDNCDFCQSRFKIQQKHVNLINQKFSDKNIFKIPLFKEEVKGIKKLKELGEVLYENKSINQVEEDAILL